jgi:hypothetical protein
MQFVVEVKGHYLHSDNQQYYYPEAYCIQVLLIRHFVDSVTIYLYYMVMFDELTKYVIYLLLDFSTSSDNSTRILSEEIHEKRRG